MEEITLQPQVNFEPFYKCGMDFVGPTNPPSGQKKYIIVCTDYLKKCLETKAVKATTEQKVVEFLRENIFYKFGYPREVVTDQGSQFTSKLMKELIEKYGIIHCKYFPYHPQANGQVESTNKVLESILTNTIQ